MGDVDAHRDVQEVFEKEAVQAFPSVVHAREKAEDAEVAAALRELLPTAELLGTAFYDEMRILLSFEDIDSHRRLVWVEILKF